MFGRDGTFDEFDVSIAAETVNQAAQHLVSVTGLPGAVGDRVQWTSNGLIWHRISDNGWLPEHQPIGEDDPNWGRDPVAVMHAKYAEDKQWWPSSHVASSGYTILETALPLDPKPWRNRYDSTRWSDPGVDGGAETEGAGVLDFAPGEGFSQRREDYPA